MSNSKDACKHSGALNYTLDKYLIMWCQECGGLRIKYNNLWYDGFECGWLKPKKKISTTISFKDNEHELRLNKVKE